MLRAKGIPFSKSRRGRAHLLLVPSDWTARALDELNSYESENRDWPPPEASAPARAPLALQGTIGYGVLLTAFHLAAGRNLGGEDWVARGSAHAASILNGEPWRVLTALFLHADPVHLLSNLLFGGLFGYLVAHTHGGGLGWLAILLSGVCGNLLNALIEDGGHVSIGASTAVFGAVGLLGGSEWRRRILLQQRRVRVAAPIVMALCLLAFHGVPREIGNVDISAHVMGFLAGLGLGTLLPHLMALGASERRFQLAAAGVTCALIAGAWVPALMGNP